MPEKWAALKDVSDFIDDRTVWVAVVLNDIDAGSLGERSAELKVELRIRWPVLLREPSLTLRQHHVRLRRVQCRKCWTDL